MSSPSVVLVLENIRSLHNVGAIFRTADGAGDTALVLTGLTPCPPRHEITKTALGTVDTVPWSYATRTADALITLRSQGYTIYALEQTAQATNLFTTTLSFPIALVVGHEREGVEPNTLALCDGQLVLPMKGTGAHSLNVAHASAIALYECQRKQWYYKENAD